jgi:hypothetical protein
MFVIVALVFSIGVMRFITLCYLSLFITYRSYEIDHCLLSLPLHSIQEL